MHGKYRRRRAHAVRDFPRKRQELGDSTNDEEPNGGGPDDLPTPVTLTIIETIAVSTSASSTMWSTFSTVTTKNLPTSTPNTSSETSSSTRATSSTSSPTSSASTPATSSTTSSSTTAAPPLSTSTADTVPSITATPRAALASSSSTLSGGGIAGVVIGILALLAVVALILLRRRAIQKRQNVTGAWARRSIITPLPFGVGYVEPKPFVFTSSVPASEVQSREPVSPGEQDAGRVGNLIVRNGTDGMSKASDSMIIAVPPQGLNSPATPATPSSTTGAGPVIAPTGTAAASPSTFTVVCTFITTLPDELAIKIGEQIRVVAKYDDGWALGMNSDGEQGMIPLECLDRGESLKLKNPISLVEARNSRRISSLAAASSYK